MPKYKIAWLPGDGVGHDVMDAAKIVLDALQLGSNPLLGFKSHHPIKKDDQNWSSYIMAEREGFEPSVPRKQYTGLAVQHLKPLSHLSVVGLEGFEPPTFTL